ncbi:MAG: hypothetical protein SVU32_02725 [Candidatus Nanohaloarchaea archaeon]|nr:hypothetical protein [Candidatus Nanohaloarchaea archaeon]
MDMIRCPSCGAEDISSFDMEDYLCLECGLTFAGTDRDGLPA